MGRKDVMSLSNKTPSVQAYRLLIYQRALHPELFGIQERRTVHHGDYELESWIVPGGHVLRFQSDGHCITEAIVDQDLQLPQRGLVHTIPCLGEKEVDETISGCVRYVSSVQTEQLSDNLFTATFNEMKDFAAEAEAMSYEWVDADGTPNFSMLDLQRFRREIHAQGYHLIGSAGFVLRTQSIFEIQG